MHAQRARHMARQQGREPPLGDQRRGGIDRLQRHARAVQRGGQQHLRFVGAQVAAHRHRDALAPVRELPQAAPEVRIREAVVRRQVLRTARRAVRGQVGGRGAHHRGALAQRAGDEVGVQVVADAHGQIDALLHEVDRPGIDVQVDGHQRMAAQELGHRGRQHLLRERLRRRCAAGRAAPRPPRPPAPPSRRPGSSMRRQRARACSPAAVRPRRRVVRCRSRAPAQASICAR